jgi:hypothetical protein
LHIALTEKLISFALLIFFDDFSLRSKSLCQIPHLGGGHLVGGVERRPFGRLLGAEWSTSCKLNPRPAISSRFPDAANNRQSDSFARMAWASSRLGARLALAPALCSVYLADHLGAEPQTP